MSDDDDVNVTSFRFLNKFNTTQQPLVAANSYTTSTERVLVTYVLPIVILVGTVGNVTSICVLSRRRMRTTSVYVFLIILAVADTTVLYVSAMKTWIRVLTNIELLNIHNATCSTVFFVLLVSQHMAAWIVVLVTVDRFLAVWFPLRATSWCTPKRAYIATAITTAVVTIYSVHVFWTYRLSDVKKRCMPAAFNGHVPAFMWLPFQLMRLLTYCGLPFVVILTLNILIVVRLRWTSTGFGISSSDGRHFVSNMAPAVADADHCSTAAPSLGGVDVTALFTRTQHTTGNSRYLQQIRMTYMLLTVSFTWLILTAPFAAYSLFVQFSSNNAQLEATRQLFKTIFFLMMYTNHAINFFLYCITGRKFRRELKEMLSCICRKRGLSTTPSVKTLRSNCVEMEPLNNDSQRANVIRQYAAQHFVTDVNNDVIVTSPRYNDFEIIDGDEN